MVGSRPNAGRILNWGACRQRPFGTILKECMAQGLGDPSQRPIKQQNIADDLGLGGVDAIGNWVRGKGFPEKGRFERLCDLLSKDESDPKRLALIKELRVAHQDRSRKNSVKIDTPAGTFHFAFTRGLAAIAVLMAMTPLVPVLGPWIGFKSEPPATTTAELVARWEVEKSAVGKAWRDIRATLALTEGQQSVLAETLAILPKGEAEELRERFVAGLVDGAEPGQGLRFQLDEVIGFFDTVSNCVNAGNCQTGAVIQYLGEPAATFWTNFGGYIEARRPGDADYGDGLEAVAGWYVEE